MQVEQTGECDRQRLDAGGGVAEQFRRAVRLAAQACRIEQAGQLARHGVTRVDQGHGFLRMHAYRADDRVLHERVVGAAEHQRIGALHQQRGNVALQHGAGGVARLAAHRALFDAFDQADAGLQQKGGAGCRADLFAQGQQFFAAQGALGGQHADPAVAA